MTKTSPHVGPSASIFQRFLWRNPDIAMPIQSHMPYPPDCNSIWPDLLSARRWLNSKSLNYHDTKLLCRRSPHPGIHFQNLPDISQQIFKLYSTIWSISETSQFILEIFGKIENFPKNDKKNASCRTRFCNVTTQFLTYFRYCSADPKLNAISP